MSDTPEWPVSGADQEAILWHDYYEAYLRQGFDPEQAFELVTTHAEAVWTAGQAHHYEIHGCPLCNAGLQEE